MNEETKKMIYVVGDIHGCYQEYLKLEEIIFKHAKEKNVSPYIVCVGDVVDRGPDSYKLVSHFLEGEEKKTHKLLLGNHEADFLRALYAYRPDIFDEYHLEFPYYLRSIQKEFGKSKKYQDFEEYRELVYSSWVEQGGEETLVSYGLDSMKPEEWNLSQEHLQFLCHLSLIWMNEDLIVSHALIGANAYNSILDMISNGDFLSQESSIDPMKREELTLAVDSCIWNREQPTERLDSKRLHISGHTPFREVHANTELGFSQIDTGCVYGIKLSAICPSTGETFSVKSETSWGS